VPEIEYLIRSYNDDKLRWTFSSFVFIKIKIKIKIKTPLFFLYIIFNRFSKIQLIPGSYSSRHRDNGNLWGRKRHGAGPRQETHGYPEASKNPISRLFSMSPRFD
jgi:hypothetical protein